MKAKLVIILPVSLAIIVILASCSKLNATLNSESAESSEASTNESTQSIEEQEIDAIIEQAEEYANLKDYKSAITVLEEGIVRYPNSAKLDVKLNQYTTELENMDIQKILSNAQIYADAKDFASAINTINKGLESYPDSTELKSKLAGYTTEYNNQIQETVLAEAATYAEIGEYVKALSVIQEAQNTYGNNAEYQKAYNTYNQKYRIATALQTASDYAEMDEYSSAIQTIDSAIAEIGNDSDLMSLRAEYLVAYQSQVNIEINKCIADSDYESALKTIIVAIEIDNNTQFQSLKTSIETQYIKHVTDIVERQLKDEKYSDASKTVAVALTILPNNADLNQLQIMINDTQPKYLLDVCKPYQTPYHYNDSIIISMGGTNYTHGFTCLGYGDNPFGNQTYFNLEGNYSYLKFIAGILDTSSYANNAKFSIYADGQLIYSFDIESGDLPTNHTVDITGCKQLMFAVFDGRSVAMYSGSYGIANILVGN